MKQSIQEQLICIQRQHGNTTHHRNEKTKMAKFSHMLRLHEKTPCQMAMTNYFQIPPHSKRYPGRKRCTLPAKTEEDLKEAKCNNNLVVSKFDTIKDLQKLREIAKKSLDGQNFQFNT